MSALPALRVVGTDSSLDELAATANYEHRCAVQSAQDVLDHARRAGEALIAAKKALPHGSFMSWVREHCSFSHTTACNYMALAKHPEFQGALSLTAALAEIVLTKVVKRSASNLDLDTLRADDRQLWLFPEDELPLEPRDPAQQRDVLLGEDRHDYRCPACANEWSGDKRPALRGALAPLRGPWRLPNRKYSTDA